MGEWVDNTFKNVHPEHKIITETSLVTNWYYDPNTNERVEEIATTKSLHRVHLGPSFPPTIKLAVEKPYGRFLEKDVVDTKTEYKEERSPWVLPKPTPPTPPPTPPPPEEPKPPPPTPPTPPTPPPPPTPPTPEVAPKRPSILSETWDDCTFEQLSLPTFHWNYSHPQGTPQGGYQIKVYGETTLDLVSDIPSTSYTPTAPPYGYNWVRNNLLFGEKTYSWQVRVKDTNGIWSDWSALKYFQTRKHSYPWISFNWNPEKPIVNVIVQFCSVFQTNICEKEPEEGWTECFALPCTWSWTFQDATPSDSTLQNPKTKFVSTGSKRVTLTVADSDGYRCSGSKTVNLTLPIPRWKEIPPF